MLHLAVLRFVADAEQNRVGPAKADVRGPRGLRILLVIRHVTQHADAYLFEHRQAAFEVLVGGLVQPVGLVLDDGGEKRPFIRKVVIHQCTRHPSPLSDLVDADLVVRPLPEDLRPQSEQLSSAVLGG